MVEVNNVDRTNPTIGSLIAKKENAEGEDYEYGTRTDTDIYVNKIDGTEKTNRDSRGITNTP